MLFDIKTLREKTLLDEVQSILVKATITSMQQFIASVDIKIQVLENEVFDLRKQRDAALETIAIPKALLAPVRKLAPELLAEIFEHCLPSEPAHITPFDNREAPLLLTHVCHRWRLVAQGLPRLWNNIVLFDRVPEFKFSSLWFNNSGSCPLDVTIYLEPDTWGNHLPQADALTSSKVLANGWREDRFMKWIWRRCTADQTQEMARAVAKQFSRMRSLKITCPEERLKDYFTSESAENATSLQELFIICHGYSWGAGVIDDNSPFRQRISSGQLHTLTLHSAAEILLPAISHTSTLRRLTLDHNCTLETLLKFISICPKIESVDAFNIETNVQQTSHMQRIIIPSLLHLGLGLTVGRRTRTSYLGTNDSNNWDHRTKPLERLRTPILQSMTLQCCPFGKRTLSACLADSSSGLRKLSLERMKLEMGSFCDSLGILVELETLAVVHSETSEGFWGSLIPEEGSLPDTWSFPRLKSLRLESTRVTHGDEDALVRLVACRAPPLRASDEQLLRGVHYLKEVSISGCNFSEETFKALERLGDTREGLSVKFEFIVTHSPSWRNSNDW